MSTKVSNNRRAYSSSTGRVAEVRFLRAALKKGLLVEKSSRDEDMRDHIDYWISLKEIGEWGVDVKGNNLPDEIWCEFKNVSGDTGWMYGKAKSLLSICQRKAVSALSIAKSLRRGAISTCRKKLSMTRGLPTSNDTLEGIELMLSHA